MAEYHLRVYVNTPRIIENEYAAQLTSKGLRYGQVYSGTCPIGIHIEGLQESIRSTARTYSGEHPETDLHKLARHATSVSLLRVNRETLKTTRKTTILLTDDGETDDITMTLTPKARGKGIKGSGTPAYVEFNLLMLQTDKTIDDETLATQIVYGEYCRVCYEFMTHNTPTSLSTWLPNGNF